MKYGGFLKAEEDFLAKAQSLPQNDSADGNGGVFDLEGTLSSVEIIAEVNSEITIADTKSLSIKLQHSDDGETYSDLQTLYALTSDGGDTIEAETQLGNRYTLPVDVKPYLKAVLTTDDAAAAGKVDIFQHYVAR